MSDDAFDEIVRNWESEAGADPAEPRATSAVTALLVPSRSLSAVAGACRSLDLTGHALATPAGVLVVGPDRGALRHAAAELSSALRTLPVLLMARDGAITDESHLRAEQWLAGALAETPNVAMVFDRLPEELQHLLLRDQPVAGRPGALDLESVPAAPVRAVFGNTSVDSAKVLRRIDMGMSAAIAAAAVLVLIAALGATQKNWVTIGVSVVALVWMLVRLRANLRAERLTRPS